MNHHALPATAEPAVALSDYAADQEARNMRSLALQLRKNGHQYRRWAREEAAKGHHAAAEALLDRAQRYAQDAIWYWHRSRQENHV